MGELFIGGDSVSNGYYNAEELTQERFIKNPFSTQSDILYKTGDLVRQLPDGNYMYVGRIDNQVKINGYRVEVSEIEHCLLQYPEISHACIMINQSENNNQYIEAYVVLKSQAVDFIASEVRQYISQYLPQFMLPRRYYHVDRIPLTANGKVNYSALVEGVKHLEMEQDG